MPEQEARSLSIHMLFPDGDENGFRVVEKSHWTGCGLVCPRAVFPTAKNREEFGRAGVYMLIGTPEEGALPTLYIGQAEPLRARLERHYRERDFWTWMVAFVSKDGWLNTAHAQALEARLVQRARQVRRAHLDNLQVPCEPGLAEAERGDVDSFLADMLRIFPLLGLTAFAQAPAPAPGRIRLSLSTAREVLAHGYESPQGFVVLAGSQAAIQPGSAAVAWLSGLHADLVQSGVLVNRETHLEFAQDYVFSAPSTAGGVIFGREVNGRTAWKDEAGRTLKQMQEGEGGNG